MNTDRTITLLKALVSDGQIADAFRDEAFEVTERMMDDEVFVDAFGEHVTQFVRRILPAAIAAVEETMDLPSTLAHYTGDVFATGLAVGLAIGELAGED